MKFSLRKSWPMLIYSGLKLIILIGFFVSLINLDFLNAGLIFIIFIFTYLPLLIERRYKVDLPIEFEIFIVAFIFCALFLGEIYNFYYTFWWWDLYLHSVSGFLLGIFGFLLVYILNQKRNIKLNLNAGFVSLFAFCFAVTGGVLWEMFEFFMDSNFGTNMLKSGLVDTMWDLIVAVFGAIIISTLGYYWQKKRIKFIIFDISISKFVKVNKEVIGKKAIK